MSWDGAILPQQVEQWILQSNDPGDRQGAAVHLLQQWSTESPCDAVAATLLALLQQTSYPTVQFYALSTLQRRSLSESQRSQLRMYLLHQFPQQLQLPTFLLNKAASILAAHLVQDAGASSWKTVESDLMQLAALHPTLFLRTIIALMEDFQSVSAAADDSGHWQESSHHSVVASSVTVDQNRRFKEVLKGYHQESANRDTPVTLLQRLFSAVTHLLETALAQDEKELQRLSLKAVTGFFQWTTVDYLGDSVQRCLELMLYTVQTSFSTSVCKVSMQAWHEWVMSCSVIGDGKDTTVLASSIQSISDPKLPVLCQLLERIHETNLLPVAASATEGPTAADSVDADTMEVIIQMSVVVNAVALEVLPLYEQQVLKKMESRSLAVEALFHQALDIFFRAFAYDDIDVATTVLPFATRLTFYMEEDDNSYGASETQVEMRGGLREHLPLVLNTLYNQMKYPIDFQYDYEDDDDAEEEMFRTELCKLYNKLVRAAPATCLQFVCEAASTQLLSNNVAAASTPDIEATLRLLYHYCEAIRPPPGLKVVMRNESFCALLKALHTSNIAQHPHREVVCLYYETAVRYYPIFLQKEQTTLLAILLGAMSGTTGLQHKHPRVRSRCCYLLLRLVKSTVTLLRPYVETAVAGIQGLLSNTKLELRPDDTLFLFETIGLLLGKTGLESSDQQCYLTAVMTPHVRSIEHMLTATPGLQRDAEHYGQVLSGSIAAITHLSKGFYRPVDDVCVVLAEPLTISLTVLQVLPNSDHVRNKTMVLLQQMILCVGKNIIPIMPKFLHLLIAHCTSDDLLFVSQIFNQLCMKFKDEAPPAIDAALLPFLQKCQSLAPAQDEVAGRSESVPPHLRTEQLSVQKLAFTVLQHIATHKATEVLLSPTNSGHFEIVLKTMSDGAIYLDDPVVKKTCIRFFRELVNQWARPSRIDDGCRLCFLTFVCQTLIPGVFLSLLSRSFNERDANYARVVSEFGHTLFALKSKSETDDLYQQSIGNMLASRAFAPEPLDVLKNVSSSEGIEECLNQILSVSKSRG